MPNPSQSKSYLYSVGFSYAAVKAEADGDNTIITNADPRKKIIVLGYNLSSVGAGTMKLQDSAGTPVVAASFKLADGGSAVYAGGLDCPAFELAPGTSLETNNTAAQDITGHITYLLVDVLP